MELRQVVKSSQTASVLQALASPEEDKRPVVSEGCEGTVVLALESEGRSGLEPALSLPQFAQISITFTASPPPVPPSLSPLHLFFILTSSSKGHQPVCYGQAEADHHQRPIGSAREPVTSPGSNPVAEGRTWGNSGVER